MTRPVKILVVDDDPRITLLVEAVLENQGYEVLAANDALTGVRLAKQHRPAVIMLDVNMPCLDGFDAVEVLRSGDTTRDIPLVMLSANRRDELDSERFLAVNCYLQKPFRLKRVLDVVQCLLANPKASIDELAQLG